MKINKFKEESQIVALTIIILSTLMAFFFWGFSFAEKKYIALLKYQPLEDVMQEMSKREYDIDNYNCLDFSKDGKIKLEQKGIKSSIIVGENPNEKYDHAFLGVWIDPQNGSFVNNWNFERVY